MKIGNIENFSLALRKVIKKLKKISYMQNVLLENVFAQIDHSIHIITR